MPELKQTIRFCKSSDGAHIAYATMGSSPPLVRAAHFLTHLEFELHTPVWRPWLGGYTRDRTLVRYDQHGCGLSDREAADLSLEAMVSDLEAVADAAGLDRFPPFGASQGGRICARGAEAQPDARTARGGEGAGRAATNRAYASLDEPRRAALLTDLEKLWTAHNTAVDGGTPYQGVYLEVVAVRA